jgi:hypothetical protein
LINLLTKNKISRICVPKQNIHRKNCTEIGVSFMGSNFFNISKLLKVQH